ncbi:hypothetical protein D3H35_00985 [Cohnella faecalis]|uniref:Uncharacterized protein n=1 Tax=Cohnella faecalis TaxID=2315694 RepID=A0A398D1L9_9BACL|nr:hypothetical protein D3H35_00985 [Cohnella faecalis]
MTVPTGPGEDGGASLWSQPKPAPIIGNDVWIGAGAQGDEGSRYRGRIGARSDRHRPYSGVRHCGRIPPRSFDIDSSPLNARDCGKRAGGNGRSQNSRKQRLFGDADAFSPASKTRQTSSEESGRETGRLNGIRKGAAL